MLRRLVVVLVLGSVVLAACGGGNDEAAPGADTGADGGTAAETGGGAGGETGVGTIDAARCAEIAQAMAAAAAAAVPQATDGDLGSSVEQLEAFAAAAPEEIRDDMQMVAEGYALIAEALEEAGYDPTSGQPPTAEQAAALTAVAEQLDSEEFQAAADRVSAYFEAGCGT